MPLRLVIVIAIVGSLVLAVSAQRGDMPEVVSPLGTKFYPNANTGERLAEAEAVFAANPKSIEAIMGLAKAQADIWHFRDAIITYTLGLSLEPNNAQLYLHRGHRYITTRQFDKAVADLEKAAQLNAKDFEIWYHMGLAHYLQGDFAKAAAAYEKCRALADKDDSVVAVSDWLYMTYRRQKKTAEAKKVLEGIKPDMKIVENKSYFDRLLFYKGLKKEDELFNPARMNDLQIATIGYGIANWYLYNGNTAKAKEYLQKIVATKFWPAFGFIAAEAELARMGKS